jgi:hypothetical protein
MTQEEEHQTQSSDRKLDTNNVSTEDETSCNDEELLAILYEESRATYESVCKTLIDHQQSKWKRREKLTANRNINTLISALQQAMIDGIAPSCCDDDEIVLNFVEDFLEESSEARENMKRAKYTLEEFQSRCRANSSAVLDRNQVELIVKPMMAAT